MRFRRFNALPKKSPRIRCWHCGHSFTPEVIKDHKVSCKRKQSTPQERATPWWVNR